MDYLCDDISVYSLFAACTSLYMYILYMYMYVENDSMCVVPVPLYTAGYTIVKGGQIHTLLCGGVKVQLYIILLLLYHC